MSAVTRMPQPNTRLPALWTERPIEESFAALQSRTVRGSYNQPVAFRIGMAPTEAEREAGRQAVAYMRSDWSTVASVKDHKTAIRLLGGGLKLASGADFDGVAEAYLFVLDGVGAKALQTAVSNLLRGKAPERFSKTFIPSAAELVTYCEEIQSSADALAYSTERLLSLPEERFEEPMSEEHCARMREKIAALAQTVRKA